MRNNRTWILVIVSVLVSIGIYHSGKVSISEACSNLEEAQSSEEIRKDALIRDIHYGYICLDSLKTLTGTIKGFDNSKRISKPLLKKHINIDITGYENDILGTGWGNWIGENGRFKEQLLSEGIYLSNNDNIHELVLPYDGGFVLIPYQMLFVMAQNAIGQ